jgi:glutaredoxin
VIRLRLLTRPGCHLCEEMREEVDHLLEDAPKEWELVDVDEDPALSSKYGSQIPVLFINGRLFARIRLPRLAARLRLLRAANR